MSPADSAADVPVYRARRLPWGEAESSATPGNTLTLTTGLQALRLVGWLVVGLMLVAMLYVAGISFTHWGGIGV